MDRRSIVIVTGMFSMMGLTSVHLHSCNNRVALHTLRFEPSPFSGVTSIFPMPPCAREFIGIVCELPTVLADGNTGPQQPNLSQENDILQFVSWSSKNEDMYVTLRPETSPTVVSTINIYLLNYPRHGISVPNFKLYGLNVTVVTNVPSSSDSVIEFDIINNSDLSLEDNIVRKITLRIRSPASYLGYLIRWNFDNLLNVSWLMMSEISPCNDPLPNYETNSISFTFPTSDSAIITPQSSVLKNGSIMLTCTVSNQGQFMWLWFDDGSSLNSSNGDITIFSADSTRTSVLMISSVEMTNETDIIYSCSVSFTIRKNYFRRNFRIFPSVMCTTETLVSVERSVSIYQSTEETRPTESLTWVELIGVTSVASFVLGNISGIFCVCCLLFVHRHLLTKKISKSKTTQINMVHNHPPDAVEAVVYYNIDELSPAETIKTQQNCAYGHAEI